MSRFLRKSPEMKSTRGVHIARYQIFYSTPNSREDIGQSKNVEKTFFSMFSACVRPPSLSGIAMIGVYCPC